MVVAGGGQQEMLERHLDRKKEDKKKREEVDVTPMESGRVDSSLSSAIPCTSHCIKNRVGYTVESNTILYRQHHDAS